MAENFLPSLEITDSVTSPADTSMLSHSLPSQSRQKSPHEGTILSSISPPSQLYLCHESCGARPPGRAWGKSWLRLLTACKCARYTNITLSHTSPRLPPRRPTSTPACERCRAGAVFALVGTAPRGWSVDWGSRADARDNDAKLPRADRSVPLWYPSYLQSKPLTLLPI